MNDDQIENPAKQAQQIFGKSSIFEVMCRTVKRRAKH